MNLRDTAKHIFVETLRRLQVGPAIECAVQCQNGQLCIREHRYDLEQFQRIVIIAAGKAALPMAEALVRVLDPALTQKQSLRGVVAGTALPSQPDGRLLYFLGGHPTPTAASLQAAKAALEMLSGVDERCLVLVLLSGGASSMMEMPLDPGTTISDLERFYRALVHSGLSIQEMNVLRKHFSGIKGGRLAVAGEGSTLCALIVSDVPANALHVVGSGPTLPDPSTVEDCRKIIASHQQVAQFDQRILDRFADPHLPETPKLRHSAFRNAACVELLSSADLCKTASDLAIELGFQTTIDSTCDEWGYREAALYLLDRISELRQAGEKFCLLSAGELSVKVGERHGLGGRNQQFALECARLVAQRGLAVTVLSAGSDGIDGNSPAAGAVADQSTIARAEALGFSSDDVLARFDSFTLFHALNEALVTGPTGNNLRDLRLLLVA